MKKFGKAFSLVELSIVILIIGVLVAAVGQGLDLLADAKLTGARQQTQSSRVASIKNLALWLETTSLDSFESKDISDGDVVTNWRDINPATSTKVQTTTTSGPTYKSSCIADLPCLSFNGTSNFFDSTTASANTISSRQVSIFAVVMPLNLSATSRSFILTNVGWTAGNFDLMITSAANNNNLGYEKFGAPNYAYSSNSIRAGVTYLFSTVDDGTTSRLFSNGTNVATGNTTGSSAIGNSGVFNIGYLFNNNANAMSGQEYFNGYISEIILFDRALNTRERQSVEKYLGQKWKIKIN